MHRAVAALLSAGVWIPRFIQVTTVATFSGCNLGLGTERSIIMSRMDVGFYLIEERY